jgi:hypothetical protein
MKYLSTLLFCLLFSNLFSQTDSLRGISLFEKSRDIVVTNPIYNKGQIILFASEKDTLKPAVIFMITMDTCGNILKNQEIKLKGVKEVNVRHGASYYTKRDVAISTTDGGYYISALADNKFASIKLDSIGGIQFIYYGSYVEFPIESMELKDGYLSITEYFVDPPYLRTTVITKIDKGGKTIWRYKYGETTNDFFLGFNVFSNNTYTLFQRNKFEKGVLYTLNFEGKILNKKEGNVDEFLITAIYHKNSWLVTESKWLDFQGKKYFQDGLSAIDTTFTPLWSSNPPLINPTTNFPANQGIINLYSSNNAIYAHTSFGIGESKNLYEGLIKFDSNGTFEWMQQDSFTNCNNNNKYLGEFYTGVTILPSGSIFISGVSITDKSANTKTTPWFSKLNFNGRFARKCKISAGADKSVNEEKWLIFPNPSSQFFEIKNNDLQAGKNYIVRIYDINSKLIYQQAINTTSTFINTDNWTNGIYLYVIYENENIIHGGKWVKIN